MKKIITLVILNVCFISKLLSQDINRLDHSIITSDSLRKKIGELMSTANVSGVALAILNNNKPVFKEAFGWANVPEKKVLTTSSEFYGASLSKAVFGYIATQLMQEKVFDPDKPLIQYLEKPLPDYQIPGRRRGYDDLRNDKRYEKITGRMCLNHTTGFPNWRWFEPDKKIKIKFEPGSRYSYSGEGLYLLQFVLEQITKKDLETLARERVFVPFKMPNTSYVWQDKFENNAVYGHNNQGKIYEIAKRKDANAAGSMTTTLDDYTNFLAAVMQKKGLKKSSFDEMIRPQVRIRSKQQFGPDAWIDSTANDGIQLSYGFAVGVMKTPYGRAFFKEGHDDGWGHYTIGFPDKGIALIIMTNNDNGESIFKEVLETAIGDKFTPWKWENYIPYNQSK